MTIKAKLRSKNWHIVIPNLTQFKQSSDQQKTQLKYLVLDRLKHRPQDKRSTIKSQFQRGLTHYKIALEHHANGVPHLDILLIYKNSILRRLTDFDYLYKHGDITTYKTLNSAILSYGNKEDKSTLHNVEIITDSITGKSIENYNEILQLQQFKADPYRYLQLQMLKDPLHFNLEQYVRMHDLAQYIPNWSSIKVKLKDMQLAAANLKLKSKSGFKYIDRKLIQSKLTSKQLSLYDSWTGYQTIVDYLNQMIVEKGARQQKTKNLLISGPPNTGKSALVWQRNPLPQRAAISNHCSVYPIGMSQWFPKYQSDVYHCIYWNQMKLTSYSYDTILKILDGSPLDLPNKGSVSRKVDNPLVIMTSNMTLDQMIYQKFGYNQDFQDMSKANLSVRIENVIIPPKYDLFLLQKLLVYF